MHFANVKQRQILPRVGKIWVSTPQNCPTTNRWGRSSVIYRTFQHYRIKKLILIQPSVMSQACVKFWQERLPLFCSIGFQPQYRSHDWTVGYLKIREICEIRENPRFRKKSKQTTQYL